ncbi:MAG: transcriptional regulator [Pirellula sp.]
MTTGPKKTKHYSYDGLERVFHEKARLGIVTCLARNRDGLLFPELKSLCELTDGNLNRHLHHLEEAGIVAIEKRPDGNRTQTVCCLTTDGSKRFNAYLDHLQQALEEARAAQRRVESKSSNTKASATGRKLTPRPEVT